jgi:predicted nucleic acid-binding Zn ribbon protein
MPLYSYQCEDCGAGLEILHAIGKAPERCGLDCQRKGGGSFGSGRIQQRLSAPNLKLSNSGVEPGHRSEEAELSPLLKAEAMRQEALQRMGGEVTERELDKLRDSGMTIYRRRGEQRWEKESGAAEAPSEVIPSQSEDS